MRIFLFLLLLCCPLCADEEIIVHVKTAETLTPIYLHPLQEKGSGLDKKYLSSLEKVLRFDFENNGKTELVAEKKSHLKIEVEIKDKILSVKLIIPGSSKSLEGLVLSGDATKDRVLMHQIHDKIFQTLFHEHGIAQTHILYTLRTRTGETSSQWVNNVWKADYDGGNAKALTSDNCLCVTPTFVPAKNGGPCRNFLYVSYKVGQPKIFASALESGAGKRVSYLRGNQLMPAIAPTLDKVAFISDITGNPDLFVQDFSLENGLLDKPRQVFCAPGATQGTPTFSPDGQKLAFVSNKDGTPRIYILDVPSPGASIKDLKPKMISKKTRENTSPAWSPDGQTIAYSALSSGVRQIWLYDIASGTETQLTDGFGHKENPAWAPNSLHLMFNSSTATTSDLFMINLNQKKVVKITNGPGEKRFPAWEPAKVRG